MIFNQIRQYYNKDIKMGNVDHSANDKLVGSLNKFKLGFLQNQPLFNIEDISFPLFTKDIQIVDSTGKRVKLAGGNWSGGHMCRHCVDGLQCRPMKDIAMDIRHKFRMNCVRLTYSLQLFYDNNIIPQKFIKANPQLIGKTAVQIFDITVQTLTDVGLMVILNNHTSSSQWCCSNDDGDGLWWSYQFPQYKFFQNCQQLARRYKDNPRVIGMDLRNELRKAHGMEATWGDNQPLTDWKRAAKITGEKVLKIAPHWLIFVAGLNYQLDLTPIFQSRLEFSVPNKLVYTGHFYSFSWPVAWSLYTYEGFKKKMFNTQTFVRALGYPYLLGQFGNNQRDVPWKYLMAYLKETDIDWTYWALDGFKCEPEKDETYGVFTNDFMDARHPDLLVDLITVGPPTGMFPIPIIEKKKNKNADPQEKKSQKKQAKKEVKQQQKQHKRSDKNEKKVVKNIQKSQLKPQQKQQKQQQLQKRQQVSTTKVQKQQIPKQQHEQLHFDQILNSCGIEIKQPEHVSAEVAIILFSAMEQHIDIIHTSTQVQLNPKKQQPQQIDNANSKEGDIAKLKIFDPKYKNSAEDQI